jgi:cob(I)alamin adenosyltransferase
MARIYTRTGDQGETSLLSGGRRSKADARVDLYGEVDELNSWLGYCVALLESSLDESPSRQDLIPDLQSHQRTLLEVSAVLADPQQSQAWTQADAGDLPQLVPPVEAMIDRLEAQLPTLKAFLLPGGSEAAAALQVARTVCRRAERRAVAIRATEAIPGLVLAFLNRLSDYLFVAARFANQLAGRPDVIWRRPEADQEDTSS